MRQARFDTFVERYNQERPHQASAMNVPADLYARSPRVYRGLEELTYPFHDQTIIVTHCGRDFHPLSSIGAPEVDADGPSAG